jgi:Leucine-rich repeat (LRR) protein
MIVPLLILIFSFTSSNSQNLPSAEFNALYDLYTATNGPFWNYRPSNTTVPWNFSTPDANPCADSWQGVTCSCVIECNVRALVLNAHNLTGPLPDSFSNLKDLENIDMSYNSMRSQLPESLGTMYKLKTLDMRQNLFTGSLPGSLGSLTVFTELYFSGNLLQYIPDSFYNNISNIGTIDLADNLLEGSLSPKIDQLTQLRFLNVELNSLNSSIPSTIGNLKELTILVLAGNSLTGAIPETIGNLGNLREFDISLNYLHATIPAVMGNLTKLTNFVLNINDLYGKLPPSLGDTPLLLFDCDQNLFSGPIPSNFGKWTDMVWLYMGGNSLTGNINILSELESLIGVAFLVNFFDGEVSPTVFGSLNKTFGYIEFSAEGNSFSGPLPFINTTKIVEYQFSNNYFTGTIAGNYTYFFDNLNYFSVGHNYLYGTIPEIMISAIHLTTVNASYNLFTGPLQGQDDFSKRLGGNLVQLSVENNFLTGTIAPSFSNLSEIITFTLSNNDFTGTIPGNFQVLHNLKTLYLNNNRFQGLMHVLLSDSLPDNMTTVDLSNNQFTGSLPSHFFEEKSVSLVTFAALSNCLTGSLPESLCQATKLVDLIMDGLSTSENCQTPLFNNIPYLNSFTLKNSIDGSVPLCFYSMPLLRTLHLSGNGLTGSLPSAGLNISSPLTDLTISHNTLTGTIPVAFQEKYWSNLDLSYNKITGTLSSSSFTALDDQNSTLYLEVNRLSGSVPSALLDLDTINLLNGNIFSCEPNGNDLPTNDPDYNSYSCGSNTVNGLLYFWLFVISLLIIIAVLFYIYRRHSAHNETNEKPTTPSVIQRLKAFLLKLRSYYDKLEEFSFANPSSSITRLHSYFKNFRKTILLVTLILIFIFLPIFVVLTAFYQSYEVEYVWNVSAVLLSSSTAGIILLFLFASFICLVYVMLLRNIQLNKLFETKQPNATITTKGTEEGSVYSTTKTGRSTLDTVLTYSIIFLIDLIIMISADILYILVVINYGAVEITLAAIALAMFRIVSNNVLATRSMPVAQYYCSKLIACCKREPQTTTASITTLSSNTYSSSPLRHRDVAFLEIMTLLNILLIPILVVLIILPDCFYNAFIQSSDVTSSFKFRLCEQYFEFSFGNTEVNTGIFCADQTQTTSYTPPFIYLYQCSSKIIIYYVPVYLILFLFAGVIIPVKNFIIFYGTAMKDENVPLPESNASHASFFRFLIPASLKRLVPNKPENESSVLFPRIRITIQLTSYLAIIIAFGTIFPPLAAIGCWTIVIITVQEELFIGRILKENDEAYHYEWYLPQLERDCRGLSSSLKLSFPWILIFSCWLFGYIIFDTWGDESGWEEALPAILIMAVIPVLLVVAWNSFYYFQQPKLRAAAGNAEGDETNTIRGSEIQLSRTSSTRQSLLSQQFVVNPVLSDSNQS